MSTPLRLRKAKSEDYEMIWNWANDSVVRAVSFSSDYIPMDEHKKWFAERLADPNHLFFIAENEEGIPMGQIRFQINGEKAIVSASLAREFRNRGQGPLIIKEASRRCILETGAKIIVAVIKPENMQSIKAFDKCGYGNKRRVIYKGFEAVELSYSMGGQEYGNQRK